MSAPDASGAHILVTGSTGFIGKVVLDELLRRRAELGIARIYLLIRPGKGDDAERRFRREIVGSPCFSQQPPDWPSLCEPLSGDITLDGLGLSPRGRYELQERVTHVIHCAASVEFDLPLAVAARINITGTLNVQSFAKRCVRLQSLVNVSTAYVTPHPGAGVPIGEELVPLPVDASEVYRSILEGTADEEALLAQTGHPNTYTLTKCLAELLAVERQDGLPMTVVRPSIVSACARYPFPGWIDSKAAFAGFVMLIALGHLRVVCARLQAVPDIVPCDHVASVITACAFTPPQEQPAIRYAVAGLGNSVSVAEIGRSLEAYYGTHPVGRGPRLRYVGTRSRYWSLADWRYHRLPLALGKRWFSLRGQRRQVRQAEKLQKVLDGLNQTFPYFTHRTYDFRATLPAPPMDRYIRTVALGVASHLLGRDRRRVPMAGLAKVRQQGRQGDVRWAFSQPNGSALMRTLGVGLRKALRLCSEEVSFDEASFEAALAKVRPGDLVVMVPSHRSYMDFMVCSMLCFAHPGLGLRMPQIAATEDFARIPIVGRVMRHCGAFFIKRGMGREDPTLTRQVTELAEAGETLEFYIEGTRSRGRRFLRPRRGMLRALQSTGQRCVVLPIAISHDRTAEDASFLGELRGKAKPRNRLGPLLGWLGRLVRGQVHLGPIHLSCGEPQPLDAESDPYALARAITAELQRQTVTTTHHLRAFLMRHPEVETDVKGLRRLIEQRGGRVLESSLKPPVDLDPLLDRSYQGHWMHLFYPDVVALAPGHPALAYHVQRNGFWRPERSPDDLDPLIPAVLEALFAPVCRDYQAVAEFVDQLPAEAASELTGKKVVAQLDGAFLPDVEDALADLAQRGFLHREKNVYSRTRQDGLADYARQCAWQPLLLEKANAA